MKEKIMMLVIILVLTGVGASLYFIKPPQVKAPEKTNDEIVKITPKTEDRYVMVKIAQSPIYGNYLTDRKGRTLYVYADDGYFISNCNEGCVERWPVYEYDNVILSLVTDPLSKRLGSTIRKNGWQQYSYYGKPLYYYIGDKNPGDINGVTPEDLGSKWSLLKPKDY